MSRVGSVQASHIPLETIAGDVVGLAGGHYRFRQPSPTWPTTMSPSCSAWPAAARCWSAGST